MKCYAPALFCLGFIPSVLLADTANISLILSQDAVSAIQLEVRQASLSQVLDKITQTTGIPIHYSVLPEGRVTATCVGATPKQILECLLNHKADLIFRSDTATHHTTKNNLEEVWVLGAKFDAISPSVTSAECETTVSKLQAQLQAMRAQAHEQQNPDQTETLLKLAQSKNPEDRVQGIGGLLAAGKTGDPAIKAALQAALSDNDANVRAQAISSYAHREGDDAAAELQTAMQDSSVDVRIMAVDSAGNNIALLKQALHDQDETVRSLAALKLESLNAENSR
jgi:hypothetical protein